MRTITFTADDRRALAHDRYHHPDPRVQRKMEVLWLKSHGLGHDDIAPSNATSTSTTRGDCRACAAASGIIPTAPWPSTRTPWRSTS